MRKTTAGVNPIKPEMFFLYAIVHRKFDASAAYKLFIRQPAPGRDLDHTVEFMIIPMISSVLHSTEKCDGIFGRHILILL